MPDVKPIAVHASSLAVVVALLLAIPTQALADEWQVAPDLDDAVLSFGLTGGTVQLNDASMFSVPFNLTEWFALAPYGLAIRSPMAKVSAAGFGAVVRFQSPFGTRPYRIFLETYVGAIAGQSDETVDGVEVDTKLRYQGISFAGAEFQVWRKLTWSLALGSAGAQDGLDAIHPRFGTANFAASTTFRWYI